MSILVIALGAVYFNAKTNFSSVSNNISAKKKIGIGPGTGDFIEADDDNIDVNMKIIFKNNLRAITNDYLKYLLPKKIVLPFKHFIYQEKVSVTSWLSESNSELLNNIADFEFTDNKITMGLKAQLGELNRDGSATSSDGKNGGGFGGNKGEDLIDPIDIEDDKNAPKI
jgi:hypothetical protein